MTHFFVFVALSTAIVILALVGLTDITRHGEVVDVRPIDDGAIVAIEHVGGGSWLERIDADGGRAWLQPIPGVLQRRSHGVAIELGERAVIARYLAGGREVRLAAFALADGGTLWDVPLFDATKAADPEEALPYGAMHELGLVVSRDVIVARTVSHHDVAVFDVESGRQIAAFTSPTDLREPRVVEGQIYVQGGGDSIFEPALTRFDRDGVAVVRGYRLCGAGARTTRVVDTSAGPQLLPLDGDASATQLRGYQGYIHACGTLDDQLAVLGWRHGSYELRALVFRRDGTLVHEVPLASAYHDLDSRHAEEGMFAGTLTRFVPYIGDAAGGASQLAVIDLERGVIAWRRTFDGGPFRSVATFREGTTWYLYSSVGFGDFAAIDGETGELRAAVEVPGAWAPPRPPNTSAQGLWTWKQEPGPVYDLPIARIDPRTLRVAGASRLELTDLTPQIAGWIAEARAVTGPAASTAGPASPAAP